MKRLLLAWCLLLAGIVCIAQSERVSAFWQSRDSNYNISISSAASYSGPGDVVSGWSAWYGVRAFSQTLAKAGATTTPVMDVLGVTTTTSCTIYLKGNGTGGLDFSTAGSGGTGHQCLLGATTFCTVTNSSCTVSKMYDQTVGLNCASGTTCNVAQGTTADQPTLIMPGSCSYPNSASIPCLQSTSASINLVGSNSFTPNGAEQMTLSAVGNRSAGTGAVAAFIGVNGSHQAINSPATANKWGINVATLAEVPSTANDATWHAANAVMKAGTNNDILNIDGTETTGTETPDTVAGFPRFTYGVASTTILAAEGGFLDNFYATQTQRTNVCANQAAYYGTAVGTYC